MKRRCGDATDPCGDAKEAAMPPILAENDKVPMATFLIHVGKSSGEYK